VLQYAYDTVLYVQRDPKQAIKIKLLLYMFEIMSSLKLNYLKSEIITVGGDNDTMTFYDEILNCQVGNLPIKYLEICVTFSNLKNY
jgi:hypothetical protein